MISLLWLRRDLRLYDHAALSAALEHPHPVQPVFVFDTNILARFSNKQDRRLTFLAHTLCALNAELKKRGGRLLVLHGEPQKVMPQLAKKWNATIFAAEDFEPETMARDAEVAKQAELVLVKDHLIFAPYEVLKGDGAPFKVFTPYAKAWRMKLSPSDYGEYIARDKGRYADVKMERALSLDDGPDALLAQIGYAPADISLWPVADAHQCLHDFVEEKATNYANTRNLMAKHGTSRISPYLRFGLVSIREALRLAVEKGATETWISELIWREFYAMILYYYPESVNKEWNARFRTIAWSYDKKMFTAWCEGKTGYPVVDAAMCELLATGWMHNRARMIVASFLTKDLQIDWRWGEEHFAQYLMDYELASNVGGWQWSASTGTDAQPWFRIFNPFLQSEKFDPDGDYIRRYVPELAHIKGRSIHNPAPLERSTYPAPIVDHAKAREKTLAMFKSA
jgi:deoxyribodipyrimidine photo-lyase